MTFIFKYYKNNGWESSQKYYNEISGNSIKEVLNYIYNKCEYSASDKRNRLSIFRKYDKPNEPLIILGYLKNTYNYLLVVNQIIVKKDNNEKTIIYDSGKYCSPKCEQELKDYKNYLDNLKKQMTYGEY